MVLKLLRMYCKILNQQKSIPVGCVPPTLYRMGGLPGQRPPSPPLTESPCTENPLNRASIPDRDPSEGKCYQRQRSFPIILNVVLNRAPPQNKIPTETPWTETPLPRQRPSGRNMGLKTEVLPLSFADVNN